MLQCVAVSRYVLLDPFAAFRLLTEHGDGRFALFAEALLPDETIALDTYSMISSSSMDYLLSNMV